MTNDTLRDEAASRIGAHFPCELRRLDQFVTWRYEQRGERRTKVLYDPRSSKRADSTDGSTWCSFDTALAMFLHTDWYDGLGFVFSADDPFFGVDLDHCVTDGRLTARATEIVCELDSYTELSPSLTGVHIIARGRLPLGRRRTGGIEMYDAGRFFTITGQRLDLCSNAVEARQLEIETLHRTVFPPALHTVQRAPARAVEKEHLFQHIDASYDGPRFKALWAGAWESLYNSQSEADLALISLLQKWIGNDRHTLDQLFRESGLYREKWDEHRGEFTYGDRTLNIILGAEA